MKNQKNGLKLKVYVALILMSSMRLTAQFDECQSKGYPEIIKHMEQLVKAANEKQDKELISYVLSNFANPASPSLSNTMIELGYWFKRSKDLTHVKTCYLNDSTAKLYYRNGLTRTIDRVKLSLSSKDRTIKSFGIWPADFVDNRIKETIKNPSSELDGYITSLVREQLFRGVVVILKDGEVIFSQTYGHKITSLPDTFAISFSMDMASLKSMIDANPTSRPFDRDDLFNLASLNKIFTAVAVMQLVEKGMLNLEDQANRWLPDIGKGELDHVKIKHLLSHTSGINGDFTKVKFTPGTDFSYSNAGFGYLGDIIEAVTGISYHHYLRMYILGPLGMAKTNSYELKKVTDELVIGYELNFIDGNYSIDPNPMLQYFPGSSAGGYYTSANDLIRFANALTTGKLISKETLEFMKVPKTELGAKDYGFGIIRWQGPGIWGHAGDLPGADADLEFYEESGHTVIVLSNMSYVNAPVLQKIRQLYAPECLKEFKK